MNNDRLFDLLTILSIILQLQVYEEQKQQTNNDDLMHELQLQDEIYFKQIIANQNKIMEELNIISPEKVDK
jgi:hypothetical protein